MNLRAPIGRVLGQREGSLPLPRGRFSRGQEAQGMVEYALILVLIAVVVIIILSVVGNQVSNVFSNVSNGLGT